MHRLRYCCERCDRCLVSASIDDAFRGQALAVLAQRQRLAAIMSGHRGC
jgi:hypothetical protein